MKQDVFFHRSDIEVFKESEEGSAEVAAVVRVGTPLSFELQLAKDGRPRARGVRQEGEAPAVTCDASTATPAVTAAAVPGGLAAGAQVDKLYTGTVKSFNAEKGFGFLACEETFAIFSRDVFLHHSQLSGFAQGDTVFFRIDVDRTKGTPKARQLQASSAVSPSDSSPVVAAENRKATAAVATLGETATVACDATVSTQAMAVVSEVVPEAMPEATESSVTAVATPCRMAAAHASSAGVTLVGPAPPPAEPLSDEMPDPPVGPPPLRPCAAAAAAAAGAAAAAMAVVSLPETSAKASAWTKYRVEGSRGDWWWNGDNGSWFKEESPGAWCKYSDPTSGRHYWWKSNSEWFWA